jgi:hypothetical protein
MWCLFKGAAVGKLAVLTNSISFRVYRTKGNCLLAAEEQFYFM